MGGSLSNNLCEHFDYARPELMALIRTDSDPTSVDSFEKVLANPSSLYVATELVRVLSYEPQPIFEVVNTFLVLWLLILRFRPLSKNFIFR